jgi:hypothetical protein
MPLRAVAAVVLWASHLYGRDRDRNSSRATIDGRICGYLGWRPDSLGGYDDVADVRYVGAKTLPGRVPQRSAEFSILDVSNQSGGYPPCVGSDVFRDGTGEGRCPATERDKLLCQNPSMVGGEPSADYTTELQAAIAGVSAKQ